jgi:RNA polymerase sporulation-specific sigma factor
MTSGISAARAARSPRTRAENRAHQAAVEVQDRLLVSRFRSGDVTALDRIIERYRGFVRLKASTYFLAGGESEDLMQEGLLGLFKAVRDYRFDREASFRSFAELCVERQMITAIKTAARKKHNPLNTCVSFSHTRAGVGDREVTLAEVLPTDPAFDPVNQAISEEELRSLVGCLREELSSLESAVLGMYMEGRSYEEIAAELGRDPKAVDNALQRVKRKVAIHLQRRDVIEMPERDAAAGL